MKLTLILAALAAPLAVTVLLPVVPGTIALYQLDEGSGTLTADAMGGVPLVAPIQEPCEWVGGLSGSALRLYDIGPDSGKEGYGRVNVRPIEVGSVYTMQAWTCFPLETTWSGSNVLAQNNDDERHFFVDGSEFAIRCSGTTMYFGVYAYDYPGWHLVTVVSDGGQTTLYIDDLVSSTIDGQVTVPITQIGNGGGDSPGAAWGTIDSFRVVLENRSYGYNQDLYDGSPLREIKDTADLYQFDEGSGYETASVIRVQGLLQGAATWMPGISGKAVDFSAPDAMLTIGAVDPGQTWTIQAWSRFPLASTTTGWRDLALNWGEHHVIVDRDGNLGTFRNGFVSSGYAVNDLAGWHLVSAVGSGTSTTYYLDDKKVGVAPAKVTSAVQYVGNHPNQNQQWGVIDSIRVLNVARADVDIAADARPAPGIGSYAYLPFPLERIWSTPPLSIGASVHGGVEFQMPVFDPTQDNARLQLEFKPLGQVFDGNGLLDGTQVPSSQVSHVFVIGLPPGSYHMRGRVISSRNVPSVWLAWGEPWHQPESQADIIITNAAPTTSAVSGPRGQIGNAEVQRFASTVNDADGDTVRLELEIVEEGRAFSGTATDVSVPAPSGSTASLSRIFERGAFVYRSRVTDAFGASTAWAGSPENRFVVEFSGSTGPASCANSAGSITAMWFAIWMPLIIMLLQRRRRNQPRR